MSEAPSHGKPAILYDVNSSGSVAYIGLARVIGKPNTGKSSFINYISKKEVSIVTNIPGTTTDAVTSTIDFKGLFTQGMVTHRTFKNAHNEWVEPGDIIRKKDLLFDKHNSPVSTGNIEKMSKSKKNVIDPGEIINLYGADTARWFVLSDSPPERDLEWTITL